MSKKKITERVTDMVSEFLSEEGYELYHIDFAKEGRDWLLRLFIERTDGEYISTDDCEKVSKFLSAKLDEEKVIEQNYYLVVSSPGLDRELIEDQHFERFAGEMVDISLYKAIDGEKTLRGRLIGLEDGNIVIEKDGEKIMLPREEAAKTKLAVIF